MELGVFAYLSRHSQEHTELENKLQHLKSKLIVGGENLFEKAKKQERLLEDSHRELEASMRGKRALLKQIKETEVENRKKKSRYGGRFPPASYFRLPRRRKLT